jgi:hypothetical protein
MATGSVGRRALRPGTRMQMRPRLRTLPTVAIRFALLLLTLSVFPTTAPADELPKEKGVARTVKMFDMFCLTQLPDIEGIERFAGFGEFAQILGVDLAPYRSGLPEEKVLAWRFHDFGAELILTAARAKPDKALMQKHPAFAKGRSVACSLLIPNDAAREDIVKELERRLGRGPDESGDDASAHVTAWNNETPKAVSRVVFTAPTGNSAKASLSASAVVKD